jgi:general secretion pathway protein G
MAGKCVQYSMARGLVIKFLFLSFVLMYSDGAFAYSSRSRVVAARTDISGGLKTGLDVFAKDCGRYPTTSEGLEALMNCPTNISNGRWRGPCLEEIPIDPYGNPYVYRCPGIHSTNGYDLYSCGYDGISKSDGGDFDDINNWDPSSPHGEDDITWSLREWLDNSPVTPFFAVILPLIPLFFAARIIASIFSHRVRDSIARYPKAHRIWLLASVAAIFLLLYFLLVPRIA